MKQSRSCQQSSTIILTRREVPDSLTKTKHVACSAWTNPHQTLDLLVMEWNCHLHHARRLRLDAYIPPLLQQPIAFQETMTGTDAS